MVSQLGFCSKASKILTVLLFGPLLVLFELAPQATAAPDELSEFPATELVKDYEQDDVDRLALVAQKRRKDGDLVGAEKVLKQALLLNEPFAADHRPRKCFGLQNTQYFIVDSLISLYREEGRLEEIEKIYEANPARVYVTSYLREELSKLFVEERKYKEARAILQTFVLQMKEPVGIGCGAPKAHYLELKSLLKQCVDRTPDATDKELDIIALKIQQHWARQPKDAVEQDFY
jgi:hypothetical protein